ncbi:MAG TPA: hypothetical protein ENH90_01925 [bacterium]|nr:hypothetical protein [bacterium]
MNDLRKEGPTLEMYFSVPSEFIFKSLKHLKQAGLVKRQYKEKKGYEYSLAFKELSIGKLKINY